MEADSPAVIKWVRGLQQPISFNSLHELEFQNAIQLHLFRQSLPSASAQRLEHTIQTDLATGVLSRTSLPWNLVFAEAVRLSIAFTSQFGNRSLDILHVAGAVVSECDSFATFDERQSKLAKAAGLKLVKI